jgi:hypothetical protein
VGVKGLTQVQTQSGDSKLIDVPPLDTVGKVGDTVVLYYGRFGSFPCEEVRSEEKE